MWSSSAFSSTSSLRHAPGQCVLVYVMQNVVHLAKYSYGCKLILSFPGWSGSFPEWDYQFPERLNSSSEWAEVSNGISRMSGSAVSHFRNERECDFSFPEWIEPFPE